MSIFSIESSADAIWRTKYEETRLQDHTRWAGELSPAYGSGQRSPWSAKAEAWADPSPELSCQLVSNWTQGLGLFMNKVIRFAARNRE